LKGSRDKNNTSDKCKPVERYKSTPKEDSERRTQRFKVEKILILSPPLFISVRIGAQSVMSANDRLKQRITEVPRWTQSGAI
jgi:hypothetical protein